MQAVSPVRSDAAIAIVGMAGLFPGSDTLEGFWDNIRRGVDSTTEVPQGRWLLEKSEAFDRRIGRPDFVYSTRGGFVPSEQFDPGSLEIDGIAVSDLDPVFQLALHVARAAWADARTDRVEVLRAGVILGNIVVPVQASAGWSREVLSSAFEEKLGLPSQAPRDIEPANVFPAGLPGRVRRASAGPGRAGIHARRSLCDVALFCCAGCRRASVRQSRRDPLRRSLAARCPLHPDGILAAPRPSGSGAGLLHSTGMPTVWSWAKGRGCSCSSDSKMRSNTAIAFTASSLPPASQTTAAATCSRPAAKASFAPCARPIKRRGGIPPTSTWSNATHTGRWPRATRWNSRASKRCGARAAGANISV